jgi:hypothetical protein
MSGLILIRCVENGYLVEFPQPTRRTVWRRKVICRNDDEVKELINEALANVKALERTIRQMEGTQWVK